MLIGKPNKDLQDRFLKSANFLAQEKRYLYFTPGMMFVVLGIFAFIAPRFLLLVLSTLLVFLGMLFCFLVWKFISFKRRVETMMREVQCKIVVQGVQVTRGTTAARQSDSQDLQPLSQQAQVDLKKITYH